MLVQKDLLIRLKDFGLNTYEAKIWSALLSRGTSTAGELSDIANVPRSRSYDVLESLYKKGFVKVEKTKPMRYIAIPPSEALETIKQKIETRTRNEISGIEELKKEEVVDELKALHRQGQNLIDPMDRSCVLKGRKSIYRHIESLLKEVKNTVHIFTTSTGIETKSDLLLHALKKAADRKIIIKILSQENPAAAKKLNEIADVRVTRTSGRFMVIDKEHVIVMFFDDGTVHPAYDAAVYLNSPQTADFFVKLFEGEWVNAR